MVRRLYVGRLSYSTTEEELRELFAKFGSVESATIVKDKYSGRSRGFGFVEMSSHSEAQEAIKRLNGTMLGDRQIVVNEATSRDNRGGGRGRY